MGELCEFELRELSKRDAWLPVRHINVARVGVLWSVHHLIPPAPQSRPLLLLAYPAISMCMLAHIRRPVSASGQPG